MEKILDLQNQSSVARLLATENITVTHKKGIKTAYFDVKHRVLGLPVWKDKGKVVYDMLVGHEVSHALFTPTDGFEKFLEKEDRKYFDILNIIEDIRIERLIKNKYAGMPRIFNGAYKELVENDFFGIKDKDIPSLGFLDRLNLRGKIGTVIDIPLSEEEEKLYQECYAAETFEDVVELYHKVKKFAEEEAEAKKEEADDNEDQESDTSEDGEGEQLEPQESDSQDDGDDFGNSSLPEDFSDEADDGTESHSIPSAVTDEEIEEALGDYLDQRKKQFAETDEDDDLGQDGAGSKADSGGEDVIIEPTTTKALEENLVDEESVEGMNGKYEAIAMWPTKTTIDKHIVGYKKVMEARTKLENFFPEDYFNPEERAQYTSKLIERSIEFKKKTNKKVGVLAREFERRKAAYQYSRAQESRRGTLDVNKLHKYKYDDQIFQSVMHLADAKSHGMIFFIDYSGSMSSVLKDVLEHTLNLVHFCKKVGIPYKVYSFTSNYALDKEDVSQSEMEFNLSDLVLAELFSSEMSSKEYNEAFQMVSCQILNSNNYRFSQQGISKFEHLGGTPLDHTLIASHQIVDDFRKKNPVQKLNVIVLTDGESHSCSPSDSWSAGTFFTNVGGKQRTIKRHYATRQYVELLKEVKGVNTIGFFLPNSKREGNQHLNRMAGHMYGQGKAYGKTGDFMKKYRKDNYFHMSNCFGYDSYFLLSSDVEIEDEDFDFSKTEGKTISGNRGEQSKLARQFAKHNVANRTNRIIMTKFAEIIA
jgi:Mg-chelatase subunit ChlD